MPEKRGVILSIILTFITFGLYAIYWMAQLSNDLSTYLGRQRRGWTEILFTLVTCGIYAIYWNYKKGKEIADAQEKAGVRVTDNSLIYLVISFFGLMAIPIWVIQADLNAIIDTATNTPVAKQVE